jgi:hypothetical protein
VSESQVLQRSVVNLTHDHEYSRHALETTLEDVRRRLQASSRSSSFSTLLL